MHIKNNQAVFCILKGELSWMAPDALPLDSEFRFQLPEINYKGEMSVNLGNHTFNLYSMSGHTPFNTAAYEPEEKVLFTSDNVAEMMPITVHCVPEWLDSLDRMLAFDADGIWKTAETVTYCFDEVKRPSRKAGVPSKPVKKRPSLIVSFQYVATHGPHQGVGNCPYVRIN